MKIQLISILLLFTLFSCNTKQNENTKIDIIPNLSDSVDIDNIEEYIITDNNGEFSDIDYYSNFSYKGIKIFENRSYAQDDYIQDLFHIMDTLVGIFYIDNQYKIKEYKIVKVNTFESDCGYTSIEPTLDTKDRCIYLIKGLKNFNSHTIDTVPGMYMTKIWANTSRNFKYRNIDYVLKAEGNILESQGSGDERWENNSHYKLYIESGNKSQCIVKMEKFNDTMTQIYWIGDLDGDNKPDLIISSPEGYEDNRLMLFLSSFANSNELVKLVSITFDSFAC